MTAKLPKNKISERRRRDPFTLLAHIRYFADNVRAAGIANNHFAVQAEMVVRQTSTLTETLWKYKAACK